MSIEQVKVSDLDCIYLTYDEPQKESFWVQIKNMVPWAQRVDGVKGSDAAHKAAAMASTTDRFILIDGDNLPDVNFFNETLILTDKNRDCVFRWKARNNINGLTYGNGGVSCWTKKFVMDMRTHEATDGNHETQVEFCFDPKYLAMNNCYSVTYPNGGAFQAWRAGFREGVKLCLDRGRRLSVREFSQMNGWYNLESLKIWHSIGADVNHGYWAMYGARLGTYMVMLDLSWDYTETQDFDKLKRLWDTVWVKTEDERKIHYRLISNEITTKLNFPVINMDAAQSAFWKKYYIMIHQNKNIMDLA